jgi:hypothetical protein
MIHIDSDGTLNSTDPRDQRLLGDHPGDWTIDGVGPQLMLLRGSAGGETALMAGEVKRTGWLIEVISFVATSRLSGTLVTESAEVRRELFFDGGLLKMASSSAREDLFGEFAVNQGVISREQLGVALAAQRPGRRLGQVLLDQGLLTGPGIYELLCRKIEKIFNDTLRVEDGWYCFLTGGDLSRLPASICIDTQALLLDGARRIDELRYYRDAVPRRTAQLESAPALLNQFTLAEQMLGCAADGRRTLEQLDGEVRLGPVVMVEACQRLKARGLLEVLTRHESDDEALLVIVSRFNRALGIVYQAVLHLTTAEQLTRLGVEFIAGGTHGNQHLRLLVPEANGQISQANVRAIFAQSPEKDRLTVIVMMLTHYLSFILFNANTHLPVEQQQAVHVHVNETLGPIWNF